MRLLIQRVSQAKVTVDGKTVGEIGNGLLIFLGVGVGDTEASCKGMAGKAARLRIFEDENGKMNLDVNHVSGSALIISQFTLYGDASKGNRPNFTSAAKPEEAKRLYELFITEMQALLGAGRVQAGVFGAMMKVELINDGPVTIWVDSC
ncbi:MAG: D-aminoacyl-tRNA deacylase [Candidatus Kapaibacterium sp.]